MEARVTQEAAGPGRFYLGLGVSKIFMRHAGLGDGAKPVAAMREAAQIIRGVLSGEALDFEGKVFSAHVPGARRRRRDAALGRAALLRRHRPDDAEGGGPGG